MNVKNILISFVNPNYQQGPLELNSFYLPYSSGLLWSYIKKFDHLAHVKLDRFVWRRDNLDTLAKDLAQNNIVGFSNYIWNKNYNYTLAKKIKQLNPECLVVFGGPQTEINNPNFFNKYEYIDIVVKNEGEIAFRRILENFNTKSFNQIPGLLINQSKQTFNTGPSERINDLDEIPSPYLTGVFDYLFEQYPEVEWNATLESNRGCPYACTFCDWGTLTYSKIKKFDLNRVLEELEWIGQRNCGFVFVTDGNFGIFPDRDSQIVDKLIEVNSKYGYPTSFNITWAKNQNKQVVAMAKKLAESDLKYGLTLSFQTFNESVLDTIKRKNILSNKAQEIFELCNQNKVPLSTEIILGLPGETLASWKENFWTLFNLGCHDNIEVYQLQILENTEMNNVQRDIHQLETVVVGDYFIGPSDIELEDIPEGVDVVVSTSTMSRDEMIDAQVFSWFITTFHCNGLTNIVSRFIHKYFGIDYQEFYTNFEIFLKENAWFCKQESEVKNYYTQWLSQYDHSIPKIDKVNLSGALNLMYKTIMEIHQQEDYNRVPTLLKDFCQAHYMIESQLLDDLINLQKNCIVHYNKLDQYPMSFQTTYNIIGYVERDEELNKLTTVEFDFTEPKNVSITTFCERIRFSRRRNYGKTKFT